MNLFWLSRNMRRNARYHCDQHMKMSLEAVQLLYTAWWMLYPSGEWIKNAPLAKNGMHGYKATHQNGSLAKWVRASRENYLMTVNYALHVCYENTKRYKKIHASQEHVEWLLKNIPPCLESLGITPIPLIVKQDVVKFVPTVREAVIEYRKFYKTKEFLRYRHSKPPKWLKLK